MTSGSCDTGKLASFDSYRKYDAVVKRCTAYLIVVRESCYPFYEPSYTELPHGCSQEVQIKKWQKEVAVRILRTQEWRRSEALDEKAREQRAQVRREKVIASSEQPEIFRRSQERTQVFFAQIEQSQEQRTQASSSPVAVSRSSRETRRNGRGATGCRPR